ncbi:MAG: nicotinate phosphoribosyltransferase [Chitinispirillaceae bacterium]|nr:nicotinate phosphoribosyltransferase [Chitinispirillaceae bacterium]
MNRNITTLINDRPVLIPAAPPAVNRPGLFFDLYVLTMTQAYFLNDQTAEASFEVSVRTLPPDWGYLVMAGLEELEGYLNTLRFSGNDLEYLGSLRLFQPEFLDFLDVFTPQVTVRALPEGTVFFPGETLLEITGPVIDGQLIEAYLLNILGFSILELTLATRIVRAAAGRPVIDFGFRRAQGPVASLRAARGALIAGFAATSNVYAAAMCDTVPSGTMAHSFIQTFPSEREAFKAYIDLYGENSVLLVDTHDCHEGIRIAADIARTNFLERGIRIRGIRIDSGDITALSHYARHCFTEAGVPFMRIFASGGLDEFSIDTLVKFDAAIDAFGVGTRFATCHYAPDLDIVYKMAAYNGNPVAKESPEKQTIPGRKSLLRTYLQNGKFAADRIVPFETGEDLLRPFERPEEIPAIRRRLTDELTYLPDSVARLRKPAIYSVENTLIGRSTLKEENRDRSHQ